VHEEDEEDEEDAASKLGEPIGGRGGIARLLETHLPVHVIEPSP
jgi:hypothetical protein